MRLRKLNRIKWSVRAVVALFLIFIPVSTVVAGDWQFHLTNLTMRQSKIRALESEVRELLHHKKETEDPVQLKVIADEIAAKYAELAKVSKEFRDEYAHVRFKHPDRGDDDERKYSRYQLKTLEQLETESGLDGKLDHIKKKVADTFGAPASEDKKPHGGHEHNEANRQPAKQTASPIADERIRLSK